MIQRPKTRSMSYNFTAQWVKGTLNNAPDVLSSNSVPDLRPHEALADWYTDKNPEGNLTEIRATTRANQDNVWLQARDFCSYAAQDQHHPYGTQYHHSLINHSP